MSFTKRTELILSSLSLHDEAPDLPLYVNRFLVPPHRLRLTAHLLHTDVHYIPIVLHLLFLGSLRVWIVSVLCSGSSTLHSAWYIIILSKYLANE